MSASNIFPNFSPLIPQSTPGMAPINIGGYQFNIVPPSIPTRTIPMYNFFGKQAAFILVDGVLPDYMEKTFDIKDGMLNGTIPVIRMGGEIPDKLDSAIIIYNASDYHNTEAAELLDQLERLNPRIQVMGVPVKG